MLNLKITGFYACQSVYWQADRASNWVFSWISGKIASMAKMECLNWFQNQCLKSGIKISSFFNKVSNNEYLSLLFVFLFFLCLNSVMYLTVSNVSSSDDQWFYTKIAYLLRDGGWKAVSNFQGAYFTELAQSGYSYGAGLYHYCLIPFTFFSNEIVGLKLSGLFFASLVPTITYWVLRKFNVKTPLVWPILFFYALASFNFTFRLFLNRPFVLIDALILVEMYLISKRKYRALFLISLINTWWHPATFWLPIVLVVCFEIITILHKKRVGYKNLVASIAGSLGGFFLFPPHSHTFLSPLNPFYFIKTLFDFVYGLEGVRIIEGAENYKGNIFNLAVQSSFFFACLIIFVVLNVMLFIYRSNNSSNDFDSNNDRAMLREYVFLVMIGIFLGFMFSGRFEDLLVPVIMLGSAIIFEMFRDCHCLRVNNDIIKKSFVICFFFLLVIFAGNRILDFRNAVGSIDNYSKYKNAGKWLKENTQKEEVIFNTDFGQFNRLFFYDSWNRYIIGIEPKNMYEFSQEDYWLWHNITISGVVYGEGNYAETEAAQKGIADKREDELKAIMIKNAKSIVPVIKNTFRSQYVFFDSDTYLRKELESDPEDYSLIYGGKDSGVYIYKIK